MRDRHGSRHARDEAPARRGVARASLQPNGSTAGGERRAHSPPGILGRRGTRDFLGTTYSLLLIKMSEKHHIVSVCFFVCSLILLHGCLIFVYVLAQCTYPPLH